MSPSDFLNLIEVLLRKIGAGRGIRSNKMNLYEPLRHMGFTQRKGRWFPAEVDAPDAYRLKQNDYARLRLALASAMDLRGAPCLGDYDIQRLDAGWVSYQEAWGRARVRVPGRTPKVFEFLLRSSGVEKKDFDEAQGLARFLEDHISKTSNAHDYTTSARNRAAIYTAFQNYHPFFSNSETVRSMQFELILDACSFSSVNSGERSETDGYIAVMERIGTPFLRQSWLAVEHLRDPGSRAAAKALDELNQNRGQQKLYDQLFRPYVIYRALDMLVDEGLDRGGELPTQMLGRRVEDLLREGKELADRNKQTKAAYLLDCVTAKIAAQRGQLSEALEGLDTIRAKANLDGFMFADLERSLSLVAALAFYRAARGKDGGYLWSARHAISFGRKAVGETFEASLRAPHKRLLQKILCSP